MTALLIVLACLAASPGGDAAARDAATRGAVDATTGVTGQAPKSPAAVSPSETSQAPAEKERTAAAEKSALKASIAQLMFVTVSGLYGPNAQDRDFFARHTPGGAVVSVLDEPGDAAGYVAKMRMMAREPLRGVPLFIAASLYDLPRQEGKNSGLFTQLPTPLAVAATGDKTIVERLAQSIAFQLSTMGFNVNLGPALELAPTLPNAKGGIGTFGASPSFTGEVGGAFVEILGKSGILAMPTGFPGGGANRIGTSPATLLTPRALLVQEDALPYAKAIQRGARLILVGNTLVPDAQGATKPACLSRAIITDLLRREMKFGGVVVAGPMDSPDIERLIDPGEAALEALEAGADMIYWGTNDARVTRAIEMIAAAVAQGRLSEERIAESSQRIVSVKSEAGLLARPMPNAKKVAAMGKKKAVLEESYDIERRSVTLLRNQGGVLPLRQGVSTPVGITGVVGVEYLESVLSKVLKPTAMQPILTARHLGEIEDFEIQRITSNASAGRTFVCTFVDTPRAEGQVRLVRELKGKGLRVVAVLLGYPRHAVELAAAGADAIVVAYSQDADCSQSLRAVADVLLGSTPVRVLPGIRSIKLQPGKPGVFNALDLVRAPAGELPIALSEEFPRGCAATYDPTMAIKKVEWAFGDGKRSHDLRAEHAYATAGKYEIQLSVRDQNGDETSGTFEVIVE